MELQWMHAMDGMIHHKEWYDSSQGYEYLSARYTSVSNVRASANQSRFLMDPNGEDYWISSFGDGGATWEDRAEKCNSINKLCPEGWRMPTVNDFKEIWCTAGINTTSTNLSNSISNLGTELRTIKDVCKYIIKWELQVVSSKRILKISALVVPDSFNEQDVSNDIWNNDNVVVRYFGATGGIEAYSHTHTFSHSPNTNLFNPQIVNMDIARPMPFGTWNASPLAIDKLTNYGYTWVSSNYTVRYTSIVDAGKTYEGAYWVSDDNMIFRFRDNQNQFGSENTNSIFGASKQPRQNAFAIRCVKDENTK